MNKNNIKTFAVWARGKLIYDINQRLERLGIFKDITLEYERKHEYEMPRESREELIKDILNKGFEEIIEEVAYIWFLRIIAFRYMEVNRFVKNISDVFLDMVQNSNIRKLDFNDEILEELDLSSEGKKLYLKNSSKEKLEELYKTIFIKRCRKFSNIMPSIFHDKNDYIEFLIPDELLKKDSIVERLVGIIDEEDFKSSVEIIGWLYQYYMSGKKDYVFRNLKENIKITKENIPAATQLFTPKWIVQYMVENSLLRAVKPLVKDRETINGSMDSADFK
ncbi:MAG: BREX-1 system adenine-specific DNA-methyltransferase PglX, partial [Clostridium sp.]|nr:BREX-1 system adenine-specific DNA-methyltransferase PglX [Clostridium sp.]